RCQTSHDPATVPDRSGHHLPARRVAGGCDCIPVDVCDQEVPARYHVIHSGRDRFARFDFDRSHFRIFARMARCANGPRRSAAKRITLMLRAEIKESLLMALSALVAHKLRSALTLLGVLVGVFSIIAVMTAMRVMQENIETSLSELGSHTFAIQKWPGFYFGGPEGFEKFWRRKSITMAQGLLVKEK